MRIEFRVEGTVTDEFRKRSRERLRSARQNMVQTGMRETLQRTIQLTPVDTARTRAAWVNALEQAGGSPPAGWEGPAPRQIASGRRLGEYQEQESSVHSSGAATNGVSYVRYLEYGTSRMAPFAMVRRALAQVRGRVASWFHWS